MRILFHILHPAHVHFFRNAIKILEGKGHEIKIIAKDKDVCLRLLDNYGLKYDLIGRQSQSIGDYIREILVTEKEIFHYLKRFNPDLTLSIGGLLNVVPAWFRRKNAIYFTDTEPGKTNGLSNLFTQKVYTPDCFFNDFGKKHIKYAGYHELAYLHPNRFSPNPEVLRESGLKEDEPFFLVRFISWQANHDVGHKGFDAERKLELINKLSGSGKIIITSEKPLEPEFEQYRMRVEPSKIHDLLYYASMYVGEGITVASESAVLGTPAILVNSLKMGYIEEEEKKYKLIFKTTNFEEILKITDELLAMPNLKGEWRRRRDNMLKDKIDVTEYMVNLIENYPDI
jgi:uncharacterized protein